MISRIVATCPILTAALLLSHCGSSPPGAVLVGQTQQMIDEGEETFREAQNMESKGKTKRAIKLYEKTATEFPFANSAGEARYREAMLRDRLGDWRDAFEAYDKFLKHFPQHPQYGKALERLAEIAIGAGTGKVRTNFLGIKGKVHIEDTVEMLETVKSHAPKSVIAAKAQFAIGEAYLADEKYNRAVAAFRKMVDDHRDHPLAPEALFQVGKILLEDAERGNQNQATLDLAREAFNDYLLQFPGHKRNAEARRMIASLSKREIDRSYDIAEFYLKTGQKDSARIYYRDIVKRTKSGELHDKAKARLKELEN